jgi:hypothetical protein
MPLLQCLPPKNCGGLIVTHPPQSSNHAENEKAQPCEHTTALFMLTWANRSKRASHEKQTELFKMVLSVSQSQIAYSI